MGIIQLCAVAAFTAQGLFTNRPTVSGARVACCPRVLDQRVRRILDFAFVWPLRFDGPDRSCAMHLGGGGRITATSSTAAWRNRLDRLTSRQKPALARRAACAQSRARAHAHNVSGAQRHDSFCTKLPLVFDQKQGARMCECTCTCAIDVRMCEWHVSVCIRLPEVASDSDAGELQMLPVAIVRVVLGF